MSTKPLLLDLFCKAGGCSYGYHLAGFDVVGVDIEPQPHYPFKFIQSDALTFPLDGFDAYHASPECKNYTHSNRPNQKSKITRDAYQRLIAPIRKRLIATNKPYVIENVMGAKYDLSANLLLCGSMFGLPMARERLFEIGNIDGLFIVPPRPRDRSIECISIVGHSVWDSRLIGTPRKDGRKRPDSVSIEIGRAAMQIDWMNINEMSQAIPPTYTRHIGLQILNFLQDKNDTWTRRSEAM